MARDKARIEIVPVHPEKGFIGPKSRRQHFVRIRGNNGRTLLVSPVTYGTKFHAERATAALVDSLKHILRHDALGVTWPAAAPLVEVLAEAEEDPNA